MCPVYDCRHCRDTGLIRVYVNPGDVLQMRNFQIDYCHCRRGNSMRARNADKRDPMVKARKGRK